MFQRKQTKFSIWGQMKELNYPWLWNTLNEIVCEQSVIKGKHVKCQV